MDYVNMVTLMNIFTFYSFPTAAVFSINDTRWYDHSNMKTKLIKNQESLMWTGVAAIFEEEQKLVHLIT